MHEISISNSFLPFNMTKLISRLGKRWAINVYSARDNLRACTHHGWRLNYANWFILFHTSMLVAWLLEPHDFDLFLCFFVWIYEYKSKTKYLEDKKHKSLDQQIYFIIRGPLKEHLWFQLKVLTKLFKLHPQVYERCRAQPGTWIIGS